MVIPTLHLPHCKDVRNVESKNILHNFTHLLGEFVATIADTWLYSLHVLSVTPRLLSLQVVITQFVWPTVTMASIDPNVKLCTNKFRFEQRTKKSHFL